MRRSEATLQECLDRIAGLGEAAEIDSPDLAADEGALVDRAGTIRSLPAKVVLGRDPAVANLVVHHHSISRRHAELIHQRATQRWALRDLGSTNGSFVEGQRVEDSVELTDRQLILFGHVAFIFLASHRRPSFVTENASEDEVPTASLIITPLSESDGVVALGTAAVRLTGAEFALVHLLAQRALREAVLPEAVRGYMRSTELSAALRLPSLSQAVHVRQLVGWVRRQLVRLSPVELIESSDRLGYRLRAAVKIAT